MPEDITDPQELGPVHFIGIGGAGMSGIARIMLSRGIAVSGSDARESASAENLRDQGAEVHIGHAAEHLGDARTVVISTAIRAENPELLAARERGLLILHRAQALASLMLGRRAIAIAGTHGKTTTTSMTTVALQACGADPSFAIGGVLSASGSNAQDGTGDLFVAEADESDGSFLHYRPEVGVITNVEPDHLDHYGTAEAVEQAFVDFSHRIRDTTGGTLVACLDDPGARRIAERAESEGIRVVGYGTGEDAEIRIVDLEHGSAGARFGLIVAGRRAGDVELQLPGEHNALNSAAAFAVGHVLGLPADRLIAGLGQFGGTRRRFELRGEVDGIRVVDDYAHHPTEVTAVLRAARGAVPAGSRVIAVFQPHLYSRTLNFQEEFAQALGLADIAIVLDIYAAREDPVPGVTGAVIADRIPLPEDQRRFTASFLEVAPEVAALARPGDMVLTIGAGDVTVLGPEILEALGS